MNKIILAATLLLCRLNANSQGLESHLPVYAQYIITLNAQSYSTKAPMADVAKMDFFNSLEGVDKAPETVSKMITHIFGKPGDYGVELLPRAYLFRLDHDSVAGWAYLFSLKDPSVFSKFLNSAFSKDGDKAFKTSASNGYNTASIGRMNAGWTSDFAIILVRDSYNPYSYSDNYYEPAVYTDNKSKAEALALEMAKQDSIAAAAALQIALDQARQDSISASKKNQKKNTGKQVKKGSAAAQAKIREEQEAATADSLAAAEQAAMETYKAEHSENDYEKANKERELKADIKMQERCERKVKSLMNLPSGKSVMSNRTFTESQKEPFDIALWMSYSGDAIPGMNPFTGRKQYADSHQSQDTSNSFLALLKDNYSVAYCTFEKGKINMQHKVFVNPEMDNLIDGLYKKKGNKNFVKYIKGTNLMGYASMSVNIEKTLKATRKIMTKTYEATMGENAKYITGFMDIYSVFTNYDVVNNLFKGDFALAITDIRPFKTSFTAYKYDDNFNRSESREEKTEVLPEFVAMASVGKPEEMKKILQAVEKMGGIKAEGAGVYLVQFPKAADYRIYIALENNIFFCTNNEELVHGKLKTGYSKSEQMTAEQKKLMCNSPVAYYWNATKTFEMIDKQPEFTSQPKMVKNLHLLKDNVKSASLTGVTKQNNAYVTNMSMDFSDTSVNSLLSIFKMINSFYLIDK